MAENLSPSSTGYLPIEDHGVIGDLHTVALVGVNGDIDWCCLPRFDSPSVFGALLDTQRAGRFTLTSSDAVRTKQMYHPDTNVLLTRFLGVDSVAEVVDFMVLGTEQAAPTAGIWSADSERPVAGSPAACVVHRRSTTAAHRTMYGSSKEWAPCSAHPLAGWCCVP